MTPYRLLALTTLVLMASQVCTAGVLTFSGNFSQDEDIVLIPFSIGTAATIDMRTTSFANGSTGFEPVLTLFDGAGNQIGQDSSGGTTPGGCGPRLIDITSGACLDAWISAPLAAGSYTLALTEWNNIPGGALSDGFPQTGNGNFTGNDFGCGGGGFFLSDCSQRTSAWALEISGTDVPEPTPAMLLTPVALAAAGFRFRRRKA